MNLPRMHLQGQTVQQGCSSALDMHRRHKAQHVLSRHRLIRCMEVPTTCSRGLDKSHIVTTTAASADWTLQQTNRRQVLAALIAAPALFLSAQLATAAGNAPQGFIINSSDPAAQQALEAALDKVIKKEKAAVVLRLVFHDAGTFSSTAGNGGMNASVRFELDRPENFGLKRGWRVIEQLSATLKGTAAEGTSYADLIALAGAKAVAVCGGPTIGLPLGRVDATAASGDPLDRLPAETLTAEQLKANFGEKGLSVQETVVLLGSHTLGSKGFGDPTTFDKTYFVSLLKKPWLNKDDSMAAMIGLASDHVLPDDAECLPFIEQYATDQELFFKDFASAYVRLTSLGAVFA